MGMSEFYGHTDWDESIATIRRALDLGVTFIDTADIYGAGHNEVLVGRAISGRRDEVQLATKFGSDRSAGDAKRGRRVSHIGLRAHAGARRPGSGQGYGRAHARVAAVAWRRAFQAASASPIGVDGGACTKGQISSAIRRQSAVADSSPSTANRPRLMRCKMT
jgi:Aldo/keto reductase family